MKIKTFKEYIIHESDSINLKNIPIDAGLENPTLYNKKLLYKTYKYFGDCKNTVDVDNMWDATVMSNFINTCEIINPTYVIDLLENGDRKIPKKFIKIINELKSNNSLTDTSQITCGLNDYQKIMFIYLTKTDTHYFFDCKK